MQREIKSQYEDPLSSLWLEAAKTLGLHVKRGGDAYATTDGQGTLFLGADSTLDPDDCLAQMILHEICHWLVQGRDSIHWPDWGLDNETNGDEELEHSCLRLQRAILQPYGLENILAPTTDFRLFYDSLPPDPFSERELSDRESIARARAALQRSKKNPWRPVLQPTLQATRKILEALDAGFASLTPTKKPSATQVNELRTLPLLTRELQASSGFHPNGLPFPQQSQPGWSENCASCAWSSEEGGKRFCLRSPQQPLAPDIPTCVGFETNVDCLTCGACCREAYDTVEVQESDLVRKKHLPLLEERTGGYDMKRRDGRCICLRGGQALTPPRGPSITERVTPPLWIPSGEPFTCASYGERPQTCHDFTLGSEHCLSARQEVGLSR